MKLMKVSCERNETLMIEKNFSGDICPLTKEVARESMISNYNKGVFCSNCILYGGNRNYTNIDGKCTHEFWCRADEYDFINK